MAAHVRRTRTEAMAKYLLEAAYTQEGLQGLLREGGSSRRQAIEKMVTGAGGTMEAMYFTFGDDDVIVLLDLPDNVTAAGLSLRVSASGAVSTSIRVLLTPEEIDAATKATVDYRPPGG